MMDIDGLKQWMKRGTGSKHEYAFQLDKSLDEITRLRAENERLREALTPSADTKAAYMGEFNMGIQMSLPGGDTDYRSVQIPWTAIKEIMAAIRARAALHHPRQDADG